MFKDKYIKDNESITPDESVKRYIKSKLKNQNKTSFGFNKNAIIATALSLCLAVGVVAVANSTKRVELPVSEAALKGEVTYDDIYDSINTLFKENRPGLWTYFTSGLMGLVAGEARDTASYSSIAEIADDAGSGADLNGSSSTNNQVEGVDEADIVKNDGRYIYTLKDRQLIITDSNNGDPKLLAAKQVTQYNETAQSMFVNGNKLVIIVSAYDQNAEETRLRIFNIENKEDPYEMAVVDQSGYYTEARMIGSTIYLLSNYRLMSDDIHKDKPEEYVPCIDYAAVPAKDISMIEDFDTPTYLVISATDITTAECTASEAVLGGAENIYADGDSLYYTFTSHRVQDGEKNKYKDATTIVKLALDPADIYTVATGSVDGRPLNQFSMDEYEGDLRIVTTVTKGEERRMDLSGNVSYASDDTASVSVSWSSTTFNSLYVLDEKLNVVGKIEDLAEDERVYSVRFDGSIGYFVTFRQTDPLFTVDLSDPQNPTILSELKIPGFSEYLHPFGEDLLFGFGKSATETGSVTGLKISMFDVSDPADVTENHVTPISASWSEASSNHKAIMVDYSKNIIAFVAADNYGISRMYVYGYDADNGFFLRNETVLESKYAYNARFVWIGEYFYLVTQNDITAFAMADFTKTAFLQF